MNIGYVVSRFPKTTETFIAREALGVSELGHTVVMVAINREPNEIVQTEAAGFLSDLTAVSDASPIGLLRSQLRWLRRSPRRLARMWWRSLIGNVGSPTFLARAAVTAMGAPWTADRLTQRGVEYLHAHWGTHSALFAHQLSLLTNLPYSVTLHAHDLYVERSMLHAKLQAAAAVVTISEHNRRMIAELYPDVADNIEVVHCGVDVEAITPRICAPTNSPPVLTVVAGLRNYKGHSYLLDAHKILEKRGVIVNLDVVGDGPLRDELEASVRGSAIEHRVTFHGARPVDEAIKIVTQSDVFVMPSVVMENGRKDGIPVALMEAMALRVPVVSTRVSGIPELIEHEVTGLLADERDPVGLADAVERLLTDDSLRERLAEAGRRRVVEQFDLSQTVAAMDRIIRQGRALPQAGS